MIRFVTLHICGPFVPSWHDHGRATGLSTIHGYYWHAFLLGDRSLVRRLQPRAFLDRRALGAVMLGMFSVAVGWLRPDRYNPAEIRLFAERVSKHSQATYGVTADEVSRAIHWELGEAAGDEDVSTVHPGLAELAVIITAVRDLELKPGDIDRMIGSAEGSRGSGASISPPIVPGSSCGGASRWQSSVGMDIRPGNAGARSEWAPSTG
ncbi:hypothetical protein NKG94_12010 [Micromonospora sp. M12]